MPVPPYQGQGTEGNPPPDPSVPPGVGG
jgi:hypothetical protein